MKKSFPKIFFLLFALVISLAFFGLISGFIYAVFWAVVFAILFYPRYEKILARFPTKPNLSAFLTLSFVLLIVIIPLFIVTVAVINEATEVYQNISTNDQSIGDQMTALKDRLPFDATALSKYGINLSQVQEKFTALLTQASQQIAGRAVGLTQNVFGFVINFFLMLYILFFFFKDGRRLVQNLIWALPIGDDVEWTLLKRFESVTRATVKGSILVALVQGTLGGLLFWAVGIPAAFLWGMMMVLASLLPIGSALVWGPWAIVLFIQGSIPQAIILVVVGAGFIGLVDNILRPRLVGQDTKMPDYLILLSTLGGLAWFGLSGFVIGPIIAALFVTCWQMLGNEYAEDIRE